MNLQFWAAVASAVAALGSAAAAGISAWVARRSLDLAERQDLRRALPLKSYLIDSYYRSELNGRMFAFCVLVSNLSDTDNAVPQIELQIRYTTAQGSEHAVKIPHDAALGRQPRNETAAFETPVRVDAHQTAKGWALFSVADSLVNGNVEGYALLLTDTRGGTVEMDQSIVNVKEFRP